MEKILADVRREAQVRTLFCVYAKADNIIKKYTANAMRIAVNSYFRRRNTECDIKSIENINRCKMIIRAVELVCNEIITAMSEDEKRLVMHALIKDKLLKDYNAPFSLRTKYRLLDKIFVKAYRCLDAGGYDKMWFDTVETDLYVKSLSFKMLKKCMNNRAGVLNKLAKDSIRDKAALCKLNEAALLKQGETIFLRKI